MSDTEPPYSKWGNSTTMPVKTGLILLGTVLLAVGLTVAVTGGTATPATPAADDEDDGTELEVTTDCEEADDGANNLTVENPTDEPAALALTWNSSEQSSIQVQTETRTESGTQTTTQIQSGVDDQSQQIRILTGTQTQTQLSTESATNGTETETTVDLITTIDAADTVTVLGLEDGTYNLSATTDEGMTDESTAVPLDQAEVTLECDSGAETPTEQTAATDGDENADEADTADP